MRLSRLALLAVFECGCAAKVTITSLEPSSIFFGPRRDLVIVGGEGNRKTRELVISELATRARQVGFFAVINSSRDGYQTRRDGGSLQLEAFGRSLGDSEVGLWIDVDNKHEGQVTRVGLSVTAFGPDGVALVQGHRVEASSETGLADAAALAAAALLDEITPSEVTRFVPLDEEDSAQLPILEVALDGNIARAREDLKVYVDHEPTNAAAIYNLAVLTEAMGRLRDALVLYDRALQLVPKSLYSEAREAAARHAELELNGQSVRPGISN